MRLLFLMLLFPMAGFAQKSWPCTGSFKTNVDKLQLRKEPNRESKAIDAFKLGAYLIWTGKTSSKMETIELRGEARTDYWYQVVGEGLAAIAYYLSEREKLKADHPSVEVKNQLRVKEDTGWVFGGGLQLVGLNFPKEMTQQVYESPFLMVKKITKKEFVEAKREQQPQPNLLENTHVKWPDESTIILQLDNGETKTIKDSLDFSVAEYIDYTYAGFYEALNLHLIWGYQGGDCENLQLWSGVTGKQIFNQCLYSRSISFAPDLNSFVIAVSIGEYGINDVCFARTKKGLFDNFFQVQFPIPLGGIEILWRGNDELLVKQAENQYFSFKLLR